MTKSACPIVDAPVFYSRLGREYTECSHWRAVALTRIAQLAPDRVIIGSSQTYDFSATQWQEGTIRILQQVAPAAGSIHILRGTPVLPFDGLACIAPRGALWNLLSSSTCTAPARDSQSSTVFHALRTASVNFENVHIVDMNDAICPAGQCAAERDGLPTYRDSQHLAAHFVATLAPVLAAQLMPASSPGMRNKGQSTLEGRM